MNIIKQVRDFLNLSSSKESIVERLLNENHISPKEASRLLRGETHLHIKIDSFEMSSGAKILGGDDNETNAYR